MPGLADNRTCCHNNGRMMTSTARRYLRQIGVRVRVRARARVRVRPRARVRMCVSSCG